MAGIVKSTPEFYAIIAGAGSGTAAVASLESPPTLSTQPPFQQPLKNTKEQLGDAQLSAVVYDVGFGYIRKPFLELSLKEYTGGFESNAVGFFNFAQSAMPLLLASVTSSPHPPTLLVTGATAAIRGVAQNASFASGKCAKRVTAQALAKEFGPQGVHVAHIIIDGGVDTPERKGKVVNEGKEDGQISPDSIADAYWWLHTQPRTSFTWEINIRPFTEKW